MNNNIWQPMCDSNITSDLDILYCRLSRDDDGDKAESNSISNQKTILTEFAAKNGFDHPILVADDGFTGTNFQRPGWQLVLQEIENGNMRSRYCIAKDTMVNRLPTKQYTVLRKTRTTITIGCPMKPPRRLYAVSFK